MSWILVNLSEKPISRFFPDRPTEISGGESRFIDAGLGDWTGFYDWLRNSQSEIIGVRFCPFEQAQFLCELPALGQWVKITPQRALMVFFGSECDYREDLSDDQAFEEARILKSTAGRYALLLGCSDLENNELRVLVANISTPDR